MPKNAEHLNHIGQAMSIKYNNLVYEMKSRGTDVIVLSLGEAFFDIPLYEFNELPYPALYHYTHSRGVPELRDKLANYYTHEYGVPVDPSKEIIITAGCKLALQTAFMAILNPGDEVIIHDPAWVTYPEQVRLCHGVPVMVPYYEETKNLGKYISNKTKAIVLNNPHNPRGHVYPREELEALYQLAKWNNLYIISDETYSDFLLDQDEFISFGRLDPEKRHTIICNSMSKNYGISGWRIGHIITNSELTNHLLKITQHILTCPATVLQYYLAKHFDRLLAITKPQIRQVVETRKAVISYMDSLGLKSLPGSATLYLFVSIEKSQLKSEEFCDHLLEKFHTCVVPGLGYGPSCDRFIRVSVGTESLERIKQGIDKIHILIERTAQ